MTNFKNSNFNLNYKKNQTNQNVYKKKKWNCDQTKIVKKLKNTNCDKTKNQDKNSKTQTV